MLSTVSGEDTQDRTDRVLLTPWVKFLWESFRQILELLKNNYLMEKIYADVAKRGDSTVVPVEGLVSHSLFYSFSVLSRVQEKNRV